MRRHPTGFPSKARQKIKKKMCRENSLVNRMIISSEKDKWKHTADVFNYWKKFKILAIYKNLVFNKCEISGKNSYNWF